MLVLKTITRLGSFRAASEELHRAQSAISYAIKEMEKEVGFPLFNRELYRPQLTAAGRVLLKKAEEVLSSYDELMDNVDFLKRGHEPLIRIAVAALWPLPPLIEALKDFNTHFPQTQVKIIHDVLSNDEQLLEDHADLTLGPIFNEQELLITKRLFDVTLVATCATGHPLVKSKMQISSDTLSQFPQIIMSSTVKSAKRSGGIINPDNVISVQDYLTKKAFLCEGLGWGLMPTHLIKEEIKKKVLVTLPQKTYTSQVHIARHSKKELGPCGKFLWDYFSNGQKKKLL